MARHLMLVFYTNKELIDRGNVIGVSGKEGLNKEIVKAIIDCGEKRKDRESCVKLAMRSKITGLIGSL